MERLRELAAMYDIPEEWIDAEAVGGSLLVDFALGSSPRAALFEGSRGDRQKARLMWLVEEYGVAEWKARVLDDLATRVGTLDVASAANKA